MFCIIGLTFYGYNQQLYTRINSLAREYISNKSEEFFQYNITEFVGKLDLDYSNVNTWSTLCNQVSKGIVSIIGYMNSDDLDWISGFCSTYRIPFLSLNNNNHLKNNFSISLMPDILPALVSIIRRYQIVQLVYIYDHTDGAHRLQQLMQMQTMNIVENLIIISRYLYNSNDSYDLLQSIEIMTNSQMPSLSSKNANLKFQHRYIVLDFYEFNTYCIMLDKIKHCGMTSSNYHYILLTLNAKQLDLTYFRYGGVNVTFFDLPSNFNEQAEKNYTDILAEEDLLSIESLLLADAWETLLHATDHILNSTKHSHEKFRIFHYGKFSNELTQNINCQNNYIQPWLEGDIYLKYLINANFQGITGNIQFSNVTGQRINYTFDVYRVTRNRMPEKIGFFRAPDTLEVKSSLIHFNDI